MPVKFLNTRGGAVAIITSCEVAGCDAPACFGQEVNMKSAIDKLVQNKIELARKAMGKWRCLEHRSIKS